MAEAAAPSGRGKKIALVLAGLVGVLILGLVGYRFWNIFQGKGPSSGGGSGRSGRRGAGGGATAVGVETVEKRVLQFSFDQVGSVESAQNVDIVAKTAGLILEVPLRQGDPVKRGQVLARIDPGQLKAGLLKKQSDLANARFTYFQLQAQQELTGVQAQSGVSIANADLLAARAMLDKAQSVYTATRTQGKTSVAQARASLVGSKASLRQAQVDYASSVAKYNRMLELQRQGFASSADLQDVYSDVLSKHAAMSLQGANVKVAENQGLNAKAQAGKDISSANADIQTARFTQASKQATLAEARAGISKTTAFRQQLAAQESLVHAAEADLELAQLQLEDTVLHSPVDGYVSDRKLDAGNVAAVGAVILTVQSGKEVWIVTSLPQETYTRLQVGLECEVMVRGARRDPFRGKVIRKDAAIDAASRQYDVRIRIDDSRHLVKPGMFAQVNIKIGTAEPRLAIPVSALVDRDEEKRTGTVYMVRDKKIHRQDVDTGFSDGNYILVTKGLQVGDSIVVQSVGNLKEGQSVDPQAPDTSSPTPGAEDTSRSSATPGS